MTDSSINNDRCADKDDSVCVSVRPLIDCVKCVNRTSDKAQEMQCTTPDSPIPLNDGDPLALVQCAHAQSGCNRQLRVDQLDQHTRACKYRPYKCIGKTINVWNCEWTGIQTDLDAHFHSDHSDLGDMFQHHAQGCVPFDGNQKTGTMNLIDAFGRRFVFYYHTDCTLRMVYFCVFLLGHPDEAKRYLVNFVLHGGPNNREKIEFQTFCPSDADDIPTMVTEERLVAVTHRSIVKYLDEQSQIHFRFVVNEKDATEPSKAIAKPLDTSSANKLDAKPAATSTSAKPKGPIKPTNLVRKGPSIPTAGSSGGGAAKTTFTSNDNSRAITNWDYTTYLPKSDPSSRPVSYAIPQEQTPSGYTTSPACLSAAASLMHCKKSGPDIFRPQPYKGVDHKFYTVKYPSSSIHKPQYRK